MGGTFGTLEPHLLGKNLDITTLAHMTIIDTKEDINKYAPSTNTFYSPDVARTTISNRRNQNYKRVIVREVVLPQDGDEDDEVNEENTEGGEDEGEEEGHEAYQPGGTQGENDPTQQPQPQSQPQQSFFEMRGSSSTLKCPLTQLSSNLSLASMWR